MKIPMRNAFAYASLMLCTTAFADTGSIVGTFETKLTNAAGSLALRLECETESACKLTTVSQSGQHPSSTDIQVLSKVKSIEKPNEAAYAFSYAYGKRADESKNVEYAELMRRLNPALSLPPTVNRCFDLNYPAPGYSVVCTLANNAEQSPSVFLLFTLMAKCTDVFCRYVIYPLSRQS